MMLAFVSCCMGFAVANQPEKIVVSENTTVDSCAIPVTVTVLSASNSVVDILVEANRVVDDVCNYFDGSWADVALTLYCSFGGDVYTCTAYKIVQAACAITGAVRLYIEGDFNNATKKVLTTGAKIWVMSKAGSKFKLSPSNMCPAE